MRRGIADWSAAVVAVAILGVGGLVVIKPAIDHWDDVYRADPFVVGTTTQKVQKRNPVERGNRARVSRTTITTTEDSSSFAERLLGKGGTVLVRLGLVALVAWLAAALLQRAILGSYGLRIGPAPARRRSAPDHALNGASPRASENADTEVVAAQNGADTAAPEQAGAATLAPAIAKLVASRREAMGLSQRELGKRAGISHTVISRIEGGEHSPSPKTLERLADALS